MIDGHRFANLCDALGRPYRTLAIIKRTGDALEVEEVGINGFPIPNAAARVIACTAPLRLFHSARAAYQARGLDLYHSEKIRD